MEVEDLENSEPSVLELSGTSLNPYTLWKLLEEMGYESEDMDRNGWQLDFWLTLVKPGFKSLVIAGTGITFEFKLYATEARGMVM